MSRVKRGVAANKKRKRILKRAKGYSGGRSKLTTVAREAVERADRHAYRGRKERKRDFRMLWIARINAAGRINGVKYSELINLLSRQSVALDRKVLADIAVSDPAGFTRLVEFARVQA